MTRKEIDTKLLLKSLNQTYEPYVGTLVKMQDRLTVL